ncbi:hypothetical protein F2Q69_00006122 [Brassica cretica]|uniref:Uncharacterized protein n=1 Tax=Brassica cretica TaxID=69181 RepID=A0A8S9P295_BRACR|nr:hypothetical protein F2Q69_00006122 [Brassica cretica]
MGQEHIYTHLKETLKADPYTFGESKLMDIGSNDPLIQQEKVISLLAHHLLPLATTFIVAGPVADRGLYPSVATPDLPCVQPFPFSSFDFTDSSFLHLLYLGFDIERIWVRSLGGFARVVKHRCLCHSGQFAASTINPVSSTGCFVRLRIVWGLGFDRSSCNSSDIFLLQSAGLFTTLLPADRSFMFLRFQASEGRCMLSHASLDALSQDPLCSACVMGPELSH